MSDSKRKLSSTLHGSLLFPGSYLVAAFNHMGSVSWCAGKYGGIFACGTCRWEDGQRVERDIEVTDRWEIHAAEEVVVTMADTTIRLKQQVSCKKHNHAATTG